MQYIWSKGMNALNYSTKIYPKYQAPMVYNFNTYTIFAPINTLLHEPGYQRFF
ncbi:hypothetical protein C8E01_102363 [Pontibacter virosus]|uniref:Uncharacterized protein n=1 Tax=Pontibacter virosus TaxID=1765052 RepID=A0A2U1B3D6_9BACT|nr:hypothetical protein C8E01_102363 [Pontibacter virosus]